MKIEVYTDGSSKGNGTNNVVGGWAYAVVVDGKVICQESNFHYGMTNQAAELTAAIKACQFITNYCLDNFANYYIYSDSAYLVNCANQNWYDKWLVNDWTNSKGAPVANQELWQKLIPYFDDFRFNFCKVKGHSDNKYNNLVDELAQAAAERGKRWKQ